MRNEMHPMYEEMQNYEARYLDNHLRDPDRFPLMDAETSAQLRRPFAVLAVKFLPIGKLDKRGNMSFLTYIDGSLVMERLDDVDPMWRGFGDWVAASDDDPLGMKHGGARARWIGVRGVARDGTGQLAFGMDWQTKQPTPPKPDDKHVKAADSDALKRAGLAFGIGAYLRNMGDTFSLPKSGPNGEHFWTYVPKQNNANGDAKFGGLNRAGKQELRAMYQRIVTHAEFVKRYGEPQAYGAIEVEDIDDVPAIEEEAVPAPALDVLVLFSKFTGRQQPEEYVRATYASKPFGKSLAQALQSVKANLGVSAEDTEKLRALATEAAAGDEDAFASLTEGLGELQNIAGPTNEEQEQMPV